MKPDNLYPFSPFLVACAPFAFVSASYYPLSQYKPAWDNIWQLKNSDYSNDLGKLIKRHTHVKSTENF